MLLADDHGIVRRGLKSLLETEPGLAVVGEAADGLEALRLCEESAPDTLIVDIGMPKLNGYEVCQRIRAQAWGKTTVIVAQTGWGQEEDKLRTREAGFDDHLVKPVDPLKLIQLIAGQT